MTDSADKPPSALWTAITTMPRATTLVDFPRTDAAGTPLGTLRMWQLTQEEQMICTAAAERFVQERLKYSSPENLGYQSLYAMAKCSEILYRACRDADDSTRPAFFSPKQVRELLTDDCERLLDIYMSIQSQA